MTPPPIHTPAPICPIPFNNPDRILAAHGGGGRWMHLLIRDLFARTFANPYLDAGQDSAALNIPAGRLAFTTDSYVVRPLFFPGGDLGSLAVNGTVNDLAMSGARPRFLSAGFILEEGLPIETLTRIVHSMQTAAAAAGVQIVTGDTKVVEHGHGDGAYINTSGIGEILHPLQIEPRSVRTGDAILLNGDLGRHGMAIMAVREGLEFESAIESDCAPLSAPVHALLDAGITLHCLRDLTRGGLTSALNEIAATANLSIRIDESTIPIRHDVRAACEILGLDPLQVACEGRFIAFLPASDAARALDILRATQPHLAPCLIGEVIPPAPAPAPVLLRTPIGIDRILDMPSGEQLPRIC